MFQNLLTPKYMSDIYEGAMVGEYYKETLPHDIIFIGDCEVYSNISPITLWEEKGITSYIRGGPQQLVWQSYYILEDTLSREKPDVVVYNTLALQYDQPDSEGYNRLNIDGMRLSASKMRSVFASKFDDESMLSYLFPILRYHGRWSELSGDDLRYFFTKDRVTHNGYMLRADVKPLEFTPPAPRLSDYNFGEGALKYLYMMTALCKEKGVELALVKSPAIWPHWYDQWDTQTENYARANNLLYINMLELSDEIGIDLSTDTFDSGVHLNILGAEKVSKYLGNVFSEKYGVRGHKDDQGYVEVWERKVKDYDNMYEIQQREFAEEGKVSTFTF
jgi:hypothetical protein